MDDFLHSNPGLASRFPRRIVFPDYTSDELTDIFVHLCGSAYVPVDAARCAVQERYTRILASNVDNFANGRDVRNLFERVMMEQANRIVALKRITNKALTRISEADVRAADASDPDYPPGRTERP